jgi:hypothetical protein
VHVLLAWTTLTVAWLSKPNPLNVNVVVSPLTTLSTSTPEISVVAAVTVNPLSWYVGVRSLSLTKRHTKALARAASNDGTINERIMVGYKNNNQKWSKTSKVVENIKSGQKQSSKTMDNTIGAC